MEPKCFVEVRLQFGVQHADSSTEAFDCGGRTSALAEWAIVPELIGLIAVVRRDVV